MNYKTTLVNSVIKSLDRRMVKGAIDVSSLNILNLLIIYQNYSLGEYNKDKENNKSYYTKAEYIDKLINKLLDTCPDLCVITDRDKEKCFPDSCESEVIPVVKLVEDDKGKDMFYKLQSKIERRKKTLILSKLDDDIEISKKEKSKKKTDVDIKEEDDKITAYEEERKRILDSTSPEAIKKRIQDELDKKAAKEKEEKAEADKKLEEEINKRIAKEKAEKEKRLEEEKISAREKEKEIEEADKKKLEEEKEARKLFEKRKEDERKKIDDEYIPIGLEDGSIPDSALTASSRHPVYGEFIHSAQNGRLNSKSNDSWAALYTNKREWWQVDVGHVVTVAKVATQGRANHDQWITSYKLLYSTDGVNFKEYNDGQILIGNTDNSTVVNQYLTPFKARYIRFNPQTWQSHVSGRFEVYKLKSEAIEREKEQERLRQIKEQEEKKERERLERVGFLIPDLNFRNYIKSLIPNAFEGEYLIKEHAETKNASIMDVEDKNIISLDGIQYFPNLGILNNNNNHLLKKLDLSENKELISLNMSNNTLFKSLDLSNNVKLMFLLIERNTSLETLDMRGMRNVDKLNIDDDNIKLLKIHENLKDNDKVKALKDKLKDKIRVEVYSADPGLTNYKFLYTLEDKLKKEEEEKNLKKKAAAEKAERERIAKEKPEKPEKEEVDKSYLNNLIYENNKTQKYSCVLPKKIYGTIPVGIADKRIPDSSLTANSYSKLKGGNNNLRPQDGRLLNRNRGDCWIPAIYTPMTYYDKNNWWQVDIGEVVTVGRVATQGRVSVPQWISSYKLLCSIDGIKYTLYDDGCILPGNSNSDGIHYNDLHPFRARYVVFNPQEWNSHPAGRFEVYQI